MTGKFLYKEAKEQILNIIASGVFKPKEKIWDERTFAKKLGYTRSTIKRACDSLVNDNILVKKKGDGTYLVDIKTDNVFEIGDTSPNSFTEIVRINKKNLASRVESFKLVYQNEAVNQIFNEQYHEFYELIRTRSVNDKVIAVQKSYIPFKKFQDAHRYDFSQMSLYDYMDFKNNKPLKFKTNIAAKATNSNDLVQAKIKLPVEYTFLLFLEYRGYNKKNDLVEYTKSWYDPTFISYKITTTR